MAILNRRGDVKLEDAVCFGGELIAVRQTFANCAREIRVLVRSPRAIINQTTPFQFGEGQPSSSDGVTLVQQFVSFAIEQNSPIPRRALVHGTLSSNARRTIMGNRVVPARMVSQDVN